MRKFDKRGDDGDDGDGGDVGDVGDVGDGSGSGDVVGGFGMCMC